ncbi:helix-turn-helix domain-containing protein [Paenarthrobacter sp. YAF11_1]|uniref:helix-turn-helix domain-containing protein n=1 Tax=Paenarthrobacter sp. YAF11_1 TaxID=3233074 RepID=UPI003F9DAABD
MSTQTQEHLLTVREAAEFLRVTPETVRRRVRAGDLPACRLGRGAIRIRRTDIDSHDVEPDSLEAHIARVVASAPPLSPEQRDRLSMLFRTSGGDAA